MNTDPLLQHFARTRPADVANLISDNPLPEQIAFLISLPADVASAVAANMPSGLLSACLVRLPPDRIAPMLLLDNKAHRMTLVAHLHESQYVSILEATPEAERSVLTTLLYSPVQTMASLAQPHFIRVNATTTCASLKRELEARDDESTPPIYVVGSDSRLLGTVSPLTVIASRNAGLILQDVMSIVEPIAGQVPVAAAVDAIQWRDHPVLPVVDVDFHLLGAVTREQLENANDGKVHEHYGLEEVLQIAAMGYIDVCAQLLDITIGGAERESH